MAVEPDPPLVDRIRQWVGETPDSGLSAVTGTIADFPAKESFDSILYIDVLEHIEDDRGGGGGFLKAGARRPSYSSCTRSSVAFHPV